jgi:signal transduction histidine kinase
VDVDSVVSVAADRQRLAVALDALIENAIEATDAGDEIRLTSFADGEWVVIEVADTGSGMPAGEQARVFQRFARVDPGRERESGGTGLGLAIVKGIVGAHRGSVSIASEPGHGTLVRLELPGDRPALGGEAPGEVAS